MAARDDSNPLMSTVITLCLVGAAGLIAAHHGDVRRDRYASLEDCRRDWQRHANDCREGSSGGHFYGPSYEAGARPATAMPQLRQGSELVRRAGFGSSGARFSAGG